jgi:hypothetical protein
MKNERVLKVQEFVLPGRYGRARKSYPSIRLQGKWLADIGVAPLSHIQLSIEGNQIIISAL